MDKSLSDLLDYCKSNNRVCPKNIHWNVVYSILPPTAEGEKPPPVPVILDDSLRTSEIIKKLILLQQIKWAYDHGVFEKVEWFIRSLPENQWHHLNE